MTIGESQAFGGVLKGSFGARRFGCAAPTSNRNCNFTDVDLENCLASCSTSAGSKAAAISALAIDASGASVYALTRGMNGTASLIGRQGALTGINVEQLLRRLERRPLSGAGDFRTGRTPYEKLTADFKITQGNAASRRCASRDPGPARRGRLGLDPEPRFRSAGHRGPRLDRRRSAARVRTAVRGAGPWDDPIMLPDTQMLIVRSPVASPLLDAVKNRNTRDTVRSAIERLTGATARRPAGRPLRGSRQASAVAAGPQHDGQPASDSTIIPATNHLARTRRRRGRDVHPLIRTLVKVTVASLIVGSVLAHFGITADVLMKESGLSLERVEELARRGISWAPRTCFWARWLSCRCGS